MALAGLTGIPEIFRILVPNLTRISDRPVATEHRC
jgi:hypothetical protein